MPHSDLVIDTFLLLRSAFFDKDLTPIPYQLRDKGNVQDDPLDEYISRLLEIGFDDAVCQKSPGPLISPDLVVYRPDLCNNTSAEILSGDTSKIFAVEVKKLERTSSGGIARATGMDYNTTPPCGLVRIYAEDDTPLDIRGYYLFIAQERIADNRYILTALALCDGNILNEDFELYLSIVSRRQKEIGLGTYGDGANRVRPMLIFSNPLGIFELDRNVTVVTDKSDDERVGLVYRISRTTSVGEKREFLAYRKTDDIPENWEVEILSDPFLQPKSRVSQTQPRGKFRLPIKLKI